MPVSFNATAPQCGTISGALVKIIRDWGVVRISIQVTSGSVTFSGEGGMIPSLTSQNFTIVAASSPVTAITVGASLPIHGFTIDATAGSCEIIAYPN